MSKMNITRKTWLYILIPLSAVTALAQYAMQGAMAGPHDPTQFSEWFWYVDYSLWALRALIESAVIVYLFQTSGSTFAQRATLACMEFALICMIAVTLGLAFRSIGYDSSMKASLGEPWFTIWSMCIAAYTPLMMGSVGYAYKVQPVEQASARAEHGAFALEQPTCKRCGREFPTERAVNAHQRFCTSIVSTNGKSEPEKERAA